MNCTVIKQGNSSTVHIYCVVDPPQILKLQTFVACIFQMNARAGPPQKSDDLYHYNKHLFIKIYKAFLIFTFSEA